MSLIFVGGHFSTEGYMQQRQRPGMKCPPFFNSAQHCC